MVNYLNPFQPNNWKSIDRLHEVDGSIMPRNTSQSNLTPVHWSEYREVEPVELLKVREKARNSMSAEEEHVDASDFLQYWTVPDRRERMRPRGDDARVPSYALKQRSVDGHIEARSYVQQIDEVEAKLNHRLIQRKQWFVDQLKLQQEQEGDDGVFTAEFVEDEKSILYEVARLKRVVGQNFEIKVESAGEGAEGEGENLCSIHFPAKKP